MGATRRKDTQEYKAEAVELVINADQPVAEIARELGINEGTLGNWVNKAKRDGVFKEKPLEVNERARLKELEEENRRVKMEREDLAKAPYPYDSILYRLQTFFFAGKSILMPLATGSIIVLLFVMVWNSRTAKPTPPAVPMCCCQTQPCGPTK